MNLLNFFKPKNSSQKVRDLVWQNKSFKLKGCLELIRQYPDAIVVAWFSETKKTFNRFLTKNGIKIDILTAENIKSSILEDKIVIFLEHNPSLTIEEKLIQNWNVQEIIILNALDDKLFESFNNVQKLMERLGFKDEYVEHSMISSSIKRAQKNSLLENLTTILSNAKKADWDNLDEVVNLKDAIKKTWSVDLYAFNLTQQQAENLKQKAPLNSNSNMIENEYQILTSENSISIHAYGSFMDFGNVMFHYKDNIYYVNVEPTVTLTTSIFNQIDILSHLAKIMIILNKQISSDRKTLLIKIEGSLEQKS